MPIETNTETDRAVGVIPTAAWRIRAMTVLPGYRLALSFMDGVQGIADLSPLVHSEHAGVYAALADVEIFNRAQLQLGAVCWPNGADLDPDWLHEEITTHGEWKAA